MAIPRGVFQQKWHMFATLFRTVNLWWWFLCIQMFFNTPTNICTTTSSIPRYLKCRRNREGAIPPSDFGRSVNPTMGGRVDYPHHITTRPPPRIFRPSFGPSYVKLLQATHSIHLSVCQNFNFRWEICRQISGCKKPKLFGKIAASINHLLSCDVIISHTMHLFVVKFGSKFQQKKQICIDFFMENTCPLMKSFLLITCH